MGSRAAVVATAETAAAAAVAGSACGLQPTPSLLALRLRMPPHPTAGVPNFGTPRQRIPIATAASSESGNTVATAPPLSLPRRPPQASRPPLPALSVPGARFAAVVANFHKLPQTYTLVQQASCQIANISSSRCCQRRVGNAAASAPAAAVIMAATRIADALFVACSLVRKLTQTYTVPYGVLSVGGSIYSL